MLQTNGIEHLALFKENVNNLLFHDGGRRLITVITNSVRASTPKHCTKAMSSEQIKYHQADQGGGGG